jgi:nicotinamidase-related amidase
MTTLDDRPQTAVVVIDVQVAVVSAAHERDAVVAAIAALVDRARKDGVCVIWVQHSDADMERGSAGWEIVPELVPARGEPVVHKSYGDAFEDTDLEKVLAERRVGRLVVTGAQTDQCVRSTLHGAFARGYDVTLVSDAHTTEDQSAWGAPPPEGVIAHTNLYWAHQDAPGRVAEVVAADDADLGRPAGL